MRLIVGLGNPGSRYSLTRHNIGWMVVDAFARGNDFPKPAKRFKSAFYGPVNIDGSDICLIRPLTYMNRSGFAVRAVMEEYEISTENVLAVYDDVALDLGRIRLRAKGSAGGHNGMRSIISMLDTDQIPRLRLGVRTSPEINDLVEYVLEPFNKRSLPILEQVIDEAVKSLRYWLQVDIQRAMSCINSIDLSE